MPERPNILLITTHDTGRHLGCYGVKTVQTPHLDTLAARGVQLTNYFATVPICCASRATMMTGRYPQSHGLLDLFFPPFNWALHEDELHLSQILHQAGYETSLFGLQHEVGDLKRLAFDRVPEKGRQDCHAVAADVVRFLRDRPPSTSPFYAQIGFFETHSPFTWGGAEPDDSLGLTIPPYVRESEPIRRMVREFQGMIRKMDTAVGAILEALAQTGLAENTLCIFTTDHGIEFPRAKWTLYDPGIEIAALFHWPRGGVTGGRPCNWLTSNVDFLPTLLELVGVPAPGKVQGLSFAAGLTGTRAQPTRRALFGMYQKSSEPRCVRTERFKLIRNFSIDRWYQRPVDLTNPAEYWVSPQAELYDLERDPLEFQNLAQQPEHQATRQELESLLFQWMEEVQDPILAGPVRTPFYEEAIVAYHQWKQSSGWRDPGGVHAAVPEAL